MTDYAELEISIFPRDPDSLSIDIRYNDPQDQASHTPVRGVVHLDPTTLLSQRLDAAAYGKTLSEALFADPPVRAYYDQARSASQSQNKALRLRLFFDPQLASLHDLRWETLRDPADNSWLLTSESLLFARFLSSNSWEKVQLRPKGELSALVMVANPQDLAEGKYEVDGQTLAAVDVAGESERARQNLDAIQVETLLSDPASPGQASLPHLVEALRKGYDILYLVAHGALLKREPPGAYLWLEGEDGKTAVTPGSDLVDRLRDLPASLRPRLVVLASCQSAGQGGMGRTSDTQGALAALGPQLAQAGIPAVIAMQGDISMETVAKFMPVFFQELARDGQVDRAMAAARSSVRERPDSWIPVLFMRLRAGRVWYVPGFGDDRSSFEKWPAILRAISRNQCTPILGPGLYENILGTQREISIRWAEAFHYPLEVHERESLPQVAQFLTVNQYERAPYDELEDYLTDLLRTRFKEYLPGNGSLQPLDEMMQAVGAKIRTVNPLDPYKVLAQLTLPVFITTNSNNLLANALTEAGKDPQVVLCPWNDYVEQLGSIYDKDPDYQPTVEKPLVFHLFGRLDEPDSIVLTEDNYFDFLIGITRNKDLIPGAVRRALADTSLLFLGFQLDDWQFRVLFRSILAQQGGERRSRYPHIAAQIEPDESRILEPDRARRYLETYFFQGANISLYWGSVDDFMRELTARLTQRVP